MYQNKLMVLLNYLNYDYQNLMAQGQLFSFQVSNLLRYRRLRNNFAEIGLVTTLFVKFILQLFNIIICSVQKSIPMYGYIYNIFSCRNFRYIIRRVKGILKHFKVVSYIFFFFCCSFFQHFSSFHKELFSPSSNFLGFHFFNRLVKLFEVDSMSFFVLKGLLYHLEFVQIFYDP